MSPAEAIILAAAVVAAVAALWRYGQKGWRAYRLGRVKVTAVSDAILGREAVVDSITGKEIAKALPGIGQRMDTVERALVALADQHTVLENHEDRIKALEDAAVERVVTRAESVAAWRAVEAVAAQQPDTESE